TFFTVCFYLLPLAYLCQIDKSYWLKTEKSKKKNRVRMFKTVRGKTICSDPNNKWTKNTMKKLDLQKSHHLRKG
uniref:Chemokine interleukin-8-like domain-containing protein n=1 Tax=Oryzias latipes TaxID=8090 RepID=A0A3B3HBF7_ORYLA